MEVEADERLQQFGKALRTTQKSTVAWRMEKQTHGAEKGSSEEGGLSE